MLTAIRESALESRSPQASTGVRSAFGQLRSRNAATFPEISSSTVASSQSKIGLEEGSFDAHDSVMPMWPRQQTSSIESSAARDGEKWSAVLCDGRLRHLDIKHWTKVDIDNNLAADCISFYLKTDHPLLGHFDPALFVSHLVTKKQIYCSSLLVNSLLYWSCQSYSSVDSATDQLALGFCTEAEQLWAIERSKANDSEINLAAALFLSMGHLGQGCHHSVRKYIAEAANMASRLGFIVIDGSQDAEARPRNMAPSSNEGRAAQTFAAWGIFNWLTLMSLFHHQPGSTCPTRPPDIAIPIGTASQPIGRRLPFKSEMIPWQPAYMGDTFTYLCWFWTIVQDVSCFRRAENQSRLPRNTDNSLAFVEYKFRKLVAWTESVPPELGSTGRNEHHVQIIRLWFHAAVFDFFRPFVGHSPTNRQSLRTCYVNSTCNPRIVCEFYAKQLKQLVENYQTKNTSSDFPLLGHAALTYVANTAWKDGYMNEDWYNHVLFWLHECHMVKKSWRVAQAIATSLTSMSLDQSDVYGYTAGYNLPEPKAPQTAPLPHDARFTHIREADFVSSYYQTAIPEGVMDQIEVEETSLLCQYNTPHY